MLKSKFCFEFGEKMTDNKIKKSKLEFVSNGDGTCYVSGLGACKDKDVMIPLTYNGECVTGIGEQAFYKKSDLTSVTIPDTVAVIGELAFYNCTGLHDIQFIGTREQWDLISKGDNWNYNVSADIFCNFREENKVAGSKNIPIFCKDFSVEEKKPKKPLAILSVYLIVIFLVVGTFFGVLHNNFKQANSVKIITFGSYEQDNNLENGKEAIEWLVLDVKDGKALVISKYALDCKQYNETYTSVTWETCTLRTWLNNDFLNSAFSESEKSKILTVTVSADSNPSYRTNPGNATKDQIFLLSITEAEKYFSYGSARECQPTAYAKAQGAWTSSSGTYAGNCWWWLRSPGWSQNNAACVSYVVNVYYDGSNVHSSSYAVRPALWIDLKS